MNTPSMTGIRSSVPQMNRYPEGAGIKALFHSVRDIALIIDKTVQAGYGYLKAGTVMAVNLSDAGGKGKLVPYVPISTSVVLGEVSAIGVAAIVKDCASGHVYVSIEDSYVFEVGDDGAVLGLPEDDFQPHGRNAAASQQITQYIPRPHRGELIRVTIQQQMRLRPHRLQQIVH